MTHYDMTLRQSDDESPSVQFPSSQRCYICDHWDKNNNEIIGDASSELNAEAVATLFDSYGLYVVQRGKDVRIAADQKHSQNLAMLIHLILKEEGVDPLAIVGSLSVER